MHALLLAGDGGKVTVERLKRHLVVKVKRASIVLTGVFDFDSGIVLGSSLPLPRPNKRREGTRAPHGADSNGSAVLDASSKGMQKREREETDSQVSPRKWTQHKANNMIFLVLLTVHPTSSILLPLFQIISRYYITKFIKN